MIVKTRWYKVWLSGIIGQGAYTTEYYQPDRNTSFSGYHRIDSYPVNPEARARWENMNVGDSFKTAANTVVERIQ